MGAAAFRLPAPVSLLLFDPAEQEEEEEEEKEIPPPSMALAAMYSDSKISPEIKIS